MLLTNHVLTGSLIGLSIGNPVVVFPLGVASHLAMDTVPHFGLPVATNINGFRDHRFLIIGGIDFLAATTVVVVLCVIFPARSFSILVGAFGAALPDLTYIPEIVMGKKVYRFIPKLEQLIVGFLGPIQKFERPRWTVVEYGWAALMLYGLGLI